MQAGFNAVYDCIKAFSETDRTDDLKKFDVPTLVIQGDDDRADRRFGPDVVQDRQGRYVENLSGCAHGLCSTLKDQVNADLLAFIRT